MKKRILSTLLALCMVLGMLPLEAFAAESEMFAEPKVTGLTVSFGGETPIDLLHDQPAISMPEGSKPVFTITFDSVELLDRVFVTSTKDGETKYLEATPKGGQYVTADYFDPIDTNYIPGTISVTYSKMTVNVNENGDLGSTNINTLKTQLTAQGISIRRETTNADGTVTAEIVLGDLFGAMSDVYFDAAVSEFMAGAGIDQGELNKWLGVYQNLSQLSSYDLESADGKNFTLYLGDGNDFGDSDTYLMLVKDATSNKYTKMLLSKAADKVGLGDIADTLSAANLASKVLLDYSAISKDTAALREEVNAHPTMTSQEKAEANAKITALDHDKKLLMMGMTAIPFFLNPVGAPLMISALIAGYSSIADYFWDYRIGMIQGCKPIENVFSEDNDHSGWTALTNEYLEERQYCITKSGNYYLAEDIFVLSFGDTDNSNVPMDATVCLHGHSIGGVTVNSGATLHVCDCKYVEHEDGTTSGGIVNGSISVNDGGKIIIDHIIQTGSGGWAKIRNDGGEVIINGGFFSSNATYGIITQNQGIVTVNGGIIQGAYYGICAAEGSKVKISGDAVVSGNSGIEADSSDVVINGGRISGLCVNSSGKLVISNESRIEGSVWNKNGGIVNIDGAEIAGRIQNESGTVDISNGTITNYAWGILNKINGTVNISGGTIVSTQSCAIENDGGIVNISGGAISGAKGNRDAINNKDGGKVIISSGTISGGTCVSNDTGAETTLLIGPKSVITFDGEIYVSYDVPTIKTVVNYDEGVTYYDSPNAIGTKKSIAELKDIDWLSQYIRLVASGASTGDDCEHEYKASITPPTCTSQGYTTYTCSLCGKTYTDNYVSALGHSYGRWVIVQEATETRTGLRERSCVVCGDIQSETIPKLDPKPSEPVENPSKPEKPAEKPAEPEKPSEPEEPVQPETPVQPQEPVVSVPVYDDVAANSWYSEAAAYVASKGLMMGTSENNFSPDAQMTRAMIWTVLGRMDGADVSSASGAWYTGAQAWSVEKGVSDGTNPNGSITRQELVTMLWRYMGSPAAAADLTVFADSADVADWAVGAIEWAVSSGIIQGSGNALNPAGTATRAEAAALLMRFCENVR